MGCFSSCTKNSDFPDVEGRFPVIEINERSDSSSDSSLKAHGTEASHDIAPLLEGPTLIAFRNLNLSSSSSSMDLEMNQIGNLLKAQDDEEIEKEKGENEIGENQDESSSEGIDGRTFKGAVPVPDE